MGLDTVELMQDVEDYFDIRISNADAEKMTTIKTMVNTICRYRNIPVSTSRALQKNVFTRLQEKLLHLDETDSTILAEASVFDYLPISNTHKWEKLEQMLELKLPRISIISPGIDKRVHCFFKKLGIDTESVAKPLEKITVSRFVDAICACNYQKLLDATTISTPYEVYVAVIGITVNKSGVEYFEVFPHSSFTDDLGLD